MVSPTTDITDSHMGSTLIETGSAAHFPRRYTTIKVIAYCGILQMHLFACAVRIYLRVISTELASSGASPLALADVGVVWHIGGRGHLWPGRACGARIPACVGTHASCLGYRHLHRTICCASFSVDVAFLLAAGARQFCAAVQPSQQRFSALAGAPQTAWL